MERKESEEENKKNQESRQDIQKQKETAEQVRKRAMGSLSQKQAREGKRRRKCAESDEYLNYFKEKNTVKKKVEEDIFELSKRKVDVEEKRMMVDIQLRQKDLEFRERELVL